MSCKMAQVNGDMPLDCNNEKYVRNLIQKVIECRATKDKHMTSVCADIFTNYKELCGSHPLLMKFENEIAQTANELGLNSCPHIVRALATTPNKKPEKKRTMIDFVEYEINEDGTLSLVRDYKMENQFSRFLHGKTERKFPPNPEEERRKNTNPLICSESCPKHQCPYNNQEHYGQPCEAQWEPKENSKMNTQAPKNPNENLLRTLEKNLETALKPLADAYKRLEAIERKIREQEEAPPHLNGENFPITRGVNQERLNYD